MVGTTIPVSFKSLTIALISAVHCFAWQRQLFRAPFRLSITVLLPHTGHGMWEFCQLLSIFFYPNYIFWDLGNNHKMNSGTHWTYCESSVRQNSINLLNFLSFHFKMESHSVSWGVREFVQIQNQYPTDSENPFVSFPTVYNYPCRRS